MSRLGIKIKEIRISKSMTQKQLGKSIGVSESFIIDLEAGKKVINEDLMKRLAKALEQDEFSFMMFKSEDESKDLKETPKISKIVKQEIQDVWGEAFGNVLKNVPVYAYDLEKSIATKTLPIIANKIEGFQKDKVVFIEVSDNDMLGFRIVKGDIALVFLTHEIENNSVCLLEYNGQRKIRQIKRLDANKVLLVSNKGSLNTETASSKDIKVLARLVRVEFSL